MTQPPEMPPYPTYPSYPPNQPPPPFGQHTVPPTPRKTGTNGFAITSLVLGILGGCFLSVVFGILALRQIKRTGQSGRGLAIAGIVLGLLWGLAVAVFGTIAVLGEADRDETGAISDSGTVTLTDLREGDCIESVTEGKQVLDVPAVPCTEPHQGEVYLVVDLPAGAYPGDAALEKDVESRCLKKLEATSPTAFNDDAVGVFYFQPTKASWSTGDRTAVCMATTEQSTTGSIAD